jgi:hypothetical protein
MCYTLRFEHDLTYCHFARQCCGSALVSVRIRIQLFCQSGSGSCVFEFDDQN